MIKERLMRFYVNLFDKIHFALPSFCIKEMVLGFIASKNMLFLPHVPDESEIENHKKLCDFRGFRLGPDGKRERTDLTFGRLRVHSYIYFSMHHCDAYIGRLFI